MLLDVRGAQSYPMVCYAAVPAAMAHGSPGTFTRMGDVLADSGRTFTSTVGREGKRLVHRVKMALQVRLLADSSANLARAQFVTRSWFDATTGLFDATTGAPLTTSGNSKIHTPMHGCAHAVQRCPHASLCGVGSLSSLLWDMLERILVHHGARACEPCTV